MPNHVHAIIILGTPSGVLGTVIRSYKSSVTRRIREALNDLALQVWQGRYHDHIVRSETALAAIQQYIVDNPARWHDDTFFA